VTAEPRIRFYAGAPIRSPEGKPLGTLCVIDTVPRSMTAADRSRLQTLAAGVSSLLHLHRTATDLQRAATHDTLTGLANRTLFDHRLEKAVADARLGRPCAMLLLDLDGFKRINDRLGHMAGDEMLQEVAQRLRKVARGTDLVARLGGDEFAILLCDPADEAAAQALCGRILTEFRAPMTLEGRSVVAQTSIGVAHCPMDAQEPGTLLRAADHALYQAKRAGRGRAVRAGERRLSLPMLSDGQELEAELRRALQADALEIAWQPFIRTATGEIAGFEALTRWTRPGHGPVEPAILIPFAEAAGLIVALESRILQLACAQAALWPKQADVSVNLFGAGLPPRTAKLRPWWAWCAKLCAPAACRLGGSAWRSPSARWSAPAMRRGRNWRLSVRWACGWRWTILEPVFPRWAICGTCRSTS